MGPTADLLENAGILRKKISNTTNMVLGHESKVSYQVTSNFGFKVILGHWHMTSLNNISVIYNAPKYHYGLRRAGNYCSTLTCDLYVTGINGWYWTKVAPGLWVPFLTRCFHWLVVLSIVTGIVLVKLFVDKSNNEINQSKCFDLHSMNTQS